MGKYPILKPREVGSVLETLCRSRTQKYIDECRSRVAAKVSAYQRLVATARNQATTDEPPLNAAVEAFEPHFFNNMVLALDSYFVHRARAIEKKDGNPLNEVRMLCNSMMNNSN